jgi:hypothetical protein
VIDISPFVGLPYRNRGRDFDGCDCLGLVLLVYAAHGVTLPDPRIHPDAVLTADNTAGAMLPAHFTRAHRPQADEIPMVLTIRGTCARYPEASAHLALALDEVWMLHALDDESGEPSRVDRIDAWRKQISGVWRHVG